MAAENVNDFKSLDNIWTGEQTFSASPMITETIASTAPSATMVNKDYVDTTVGSVSEIVDAINNTKATVEQLPVLSYTLADHTLNSMDWKVADGEWCDPALYSTIFKHLTDDISNSENGISSEIVSALDKSTSWTVYYYAAKDGHKIVPCTYNDINQKAILDEIYNINEEAWYYCYDSTSGFILPRKKFTTVDTMAELKAYVDEKISEMSKNMRDYTIDFTKTDGFMSGTSWPMKIKYPSRIEVHGNGAFYMSTDGINYRLCANMGTDYSSTVFYTSDNVALSGKSNCKVYIAPIKG